MAKGGRRGRKRKEGNRTKSGRLILPGPMKDNGTEEMQKRRQILAGGGDQTLTSTFLGTMLANNRITRSEYDAGCRYAWLYGVLFGRTSAAAAAYGQTIGGREHDEQWLADRQREYTEIARRLLGAGRRVKDAVDNAAIYDRWPRWAGAAVRIARPTTIRPSDIAQRNECEAGLILLAQVLGFQHPKDRKLAA